MSPLPDKDERAERGAPREGEAEERREGPDVRRSAAPGGGDATGNEAASERESTIDAAVEMTFPASDPPAWMPPGGTRR